MRPLFAPRATDTVPRWRASAKLKRRTLAARLSALAERAIKELEASPRVDLAKLRGALELLRMTKLAERPRRRGQARREKAPSLLTAEARARVIADLRANGVEVARAPGELADFIESCVAPIRWTTRRCASAAGARSATGTMRGCWRGMGRSGQSA